MNVFLAILALIAIGLGSYFMLNESVCELYFDVKKKKEESASPWPLVISAGGAGLIALLALLAIIFHWWIFAPLVILLAGIWQRFSYSKFSWILLGGLLLTGWLATAVVPANFTEMLAAFFGRWIFSLIATGIYCALSWRSYAEDKQEDNTAEVVKATVKEVLDEKAKEGESK